MNTVLLFLNMGGSEMTVILIMIFLLFGGKGIPNVARTLGKTVREFKDAASGIQRDIMNTSTEIEREIINTSSSISKEVNEQVQKIQREIEPEKKENPVKKDEIA
ncbi:MAG: twin-arginine translocase TatA/TatE family subunit [Bacteroidia bacterium]|nr:twin-arginine translocase TatA/TatE family subunit [Bacteroidia bacterium]